jgi:hypothetical protein
MSRRMKDVLIALTLSAATLAIWNFSQAPESGWLYQWRGSGDLRSAIDACRRTDSDLDTSLGLELEMRIYPFTIESKSGHDFLWQSEKCMKTHGFRLDRSIQAANENSQYLDYYESVAGIRPKTPAQLAEEAAAKQAAQAATAAREAELDAIALTRCGDKSLATIGDVERCKRIAAEQSARR